MIQCTLVVLWPYVARQENKSVDLKMECVCLQVVRVGCAGMGGGEEVGSGPLALFKNDNY